MDQPTKVLILSADPRLAEPATEVLLRGGFVVDRATDVPSALDGVRAHRPPDIVLVDATTAVDVAPFLDRLGDELPGAPPKTVLLAAHHTAQRLREHPSVVYVVEAPAAVRSLVALADWIGERDPHTRPSLVLKPLSRVASRSPEKKRRHLS